jgi:hypothetical protein
MRKLIGSGSLAGMFGLLTVVGSVQAQELPQLVRTWKGTGLCGSVALNGAP